MKKLALILILGIFAVALGANTMTENGRWLGPKVDRINNSISAHSVVTQAKINNAKIDMCDKPGEAAPSDVIPYAVEWELDISANNGTLGCTPVFDTLLWVSSCGDGAGTSTDNMMYIYNLNTRTLVDSFAQATTYGWGYRDMCFYNGYVYAGDSTILHKIDPTTHTVVGTYPVTGISGTRIRALTDNDVQDSLFTANWATPIYKFANTGGAVRTLGSNTYSLYGLAYDPHGYFWGSSQTTNAELVKYNYPSCTVAGYGSLPEMTSVGSIAGGCEMWRDSFLLYVAQGDRILCLRLYGFPNTDIKTQSISAPGSVTPYKRVSIQAIVQNLGVNPAPINTPVKMQITGPSAYVYNDVDQVTTRALVFGDTNLITFSPQWQAPGVLGIYTVKVWIELAGDENPGNDTLTMTIDVTNWINYADFNGAGYFYSDLAGEKATNFVPRELGVIPPVTIESVYAQFYDATNHTQSPSPTRDSLIKFKIYNSDGITLLYESDTIRLPVVANSRYSIIYGLNTPVAITGAHYYVSVVPHGDSNPKLLSDDSSQGRSFSGEPGSWTVNSSGEWHIASFVNWTPRNNDASTISIAAPTTMVTPLVSMNPKALIANYGFNDQTTIPVNCKIDSAGSTIYAGTASAALISGDTVTVSFNPTWTPGPAGAVYDITMYTSLGTDEYLNNDTITGFTSSYVATTVINSNYTTTPPNIDGDIQPSEWSDVEQNDISDILGRSGVVSYAGSAYLWVKHDANNVYFACAMPHATTSDTSDQLGIYLDENNDGVWATDSSEGNYWLVNVDPGTDYIEYRCHPFTNPSVWATLVSGAQINANLTNGYMQFEASIPIGSFKEYINANPNGDTLGFWMYADDNPTSRYYGWWSQYTAADSWSSASAYGKLILRNPADVGVDAILAPAGTLFQGEQVMPSAIIQNNGPLSTSIFPVIFTINEQKAGEYIDTVMLSLDPGQIDTVEFDPYTASTISIFATQVQVVLPGDGVPGNDIMAGSGFEVTLPPAAFWQRKADIPTAVSGKGVKDGGSLVGVSSGKTNNLYAFRGNKSNEFYKWTPNTWNAKCTLAYGLKPLIPIDSTKINKKRVGKGGSLCYDGNDIIYATKGNSTTEFWAYSISGNTWTAKAFVTVPKALKGGTSIVYLNGKVYLLAGNQKKTDLNNFYVYDVASNIWTAGAPITLGPSIKVFKDGSCITELNGDIYALKGGDKGNYFYAYDTATTIWSVSDSMPLGDSLLGKWKKKLLVKDGAAMTNDGNTIYMIKGGGYNVFWKYVPASGWSRFESIPRFDKKSVPKTGAAITCVGGYIYLLKGNNTIEMWSYGPLYGDKVVTNTPVTRTNTAVMTENTTTTHTFSFDVTPNPFSKLTTVRYTVPVAGNVSVKLYSTTGRLITTVYDGYLNEGNHTTNLMITNISNGVYFLRYEDKTNRAEIKLIVK